MKLPFALLLVSAAAVAAAENFTNPAPYLSIERHVEGVGLRVIGDAGVRYEKRVGTDPGSLTSESSYISDDTNAVLWMDGQGTKFFQWVSDDQMRFPVWRDWVETKLTFNFQPVRPGGTFFLDTYADGVLWDHLEDNVSNWADPATGIVWLADGGPTPVNGYPYQQFEFHFSWTPPETGASPYTKVLTKKQRRRNRVNGRPGTNGIVVQHHEAYGCGPQGAIDAVQRVVFSNSILTVAQNDLDGVRLNATNQPPSMAGPNEWTKFKFLLLTNHSLTHLHYYGDGSNSHLGSREHPGERITTAQLASSPRLPTNLLTYVALDGCVTGDGDLLKYLIGYKRLQDFSFPQPGYQGGWKKCFGWGWSAGKTNFTSGLHFEFIQAFYDDLGELDPFAPYPSSVWSYREAYERARRLPNGDENVEARYFKPVGCFDCSFPE